MFIVSPWFFMRGRDERGDAHRLNEDETFALSDVRCSNSHAARLEGWVAFERGCAIR
jgi:hypothetical protein